MMIKAKKIQRVLPLALLIFVTAGAFIRIEDVTHAMLGALSVCAKALVPSIFPFLLLTELLLHVPYGKRALSCLGKPFSFCFRTSRAGGAVYLIGILFGFPLAVKALAEYYKDNSITRKEAERILLFSNNTGPAFLIGGVGARLLHSVKMGLFLYLLQVLVSFVFGCVLGLLSKKENESTRKNSRSYVLPISFSEIMRSSTLQMLSICGYVAFFSVIGALLSPFVRALPMRAILYALLEVGSASSFVSSTLSSSPLLFPLLAFSICFSGLSVYLQSLDFLSETDLSSSLYLPSKLLHGALAFFLSLLFFPCFA